MTLIYQQRNYPSTPTELAQPKEGCAPAGEPATWVFSGCGCQRQSCFSILLPTRASVNRAWALEKCGFYHADQTPLMLNPTSYGDTIYIYTTIVFRFGKEANASVYHFLMFMQTVQICTTTRHHGGAARPVGRAEGAPCVCVATYLSSSRKH